MTGTKNARFLLVRGGIAAVILGAVMARGLSAPAIAGGARSPSPSDVAELELLGQYLARQPVHPLFVARPLEGIALADSLSALAQAGRPSPRMSALDLPRPAGVPVRRWVLSAIMITESRRVAVVNDSLVSVGERVGGGATVIAIEPDRVILLESGGARRELRMQSGSQQ
jgi:hypothetical protein